MGARHLRPHLGLVCDSAALFLVPFEFGEATPHTGRVDDHAEREAFVADGTVGADGFGGFECGVVAA